MNARTSASSVFNCKYSFWENLVKNQNCQLKLKFGIKTNSNIYDSMVVVTFYVLNRKHPFWKNVVQENQNYQFKLKFGTYTNSIMQFIHNSIMNSMVVFSFSVFNRKYPFWADLVQKIKIV